MTDATTTVPLPERPVDLDGLPFVVRGTTTAEVQWGRHRFPVVYEWRYERSGGDVVATYSTVDGRPLLDEVQRGRFAHVRDIMLRLRSRAADAKQQAAT